jgi:hypothetical protein
MTETVQSIIALGRSLGLQGFAKSEGRDTKAVDDQKPGAGAAALDVARQAGLKDFQASTEPTRRNESTMGLAVRLGLPGFVEKSEAPTPNPVAVSPPMRMPRPAAAAAPMQKPLLPTAAAEPMSKHRFVIIDIAAGSAAAFTVIEGKMGQSFAPAAWLQRTNADGSQTRAYVTMESEGKKLEAMSGDLGSPSVRLSVGTIPRSQFAIHTASGPVPAGTQARTAFVDPDVPAALQRALGR